jgi:hypothetical protein
MFEITAQSVPLQITWPLKNGTRLSVNVVASVLSVIWQGLSSIGGLFADLDYSGGY